MALTWGVVPASAPVRHYRPREFYERARDRNRVTARQLQQLGVLPPSRSYDPVYAEVFRFLPSGITSNQA